MKYVTAEKDRHGKVRYRFRAPWCRKWLTERDPNSAAFIMECGELFARRPVETPIKIDDPAPGTIEALIAAYSTSEEWRRLADETHKQRRNVYWRVIKTDWRNRVVETLTVRDGRAFNTVFGLNGRKAIDPVFRWAFDRGEMDVIPWRDVPRPAPKNRRGPDGFVQWQPEHVKAYVETHERGSMAYLALVVLITTGLRRRDASRFGPQHIEDGWFRYGMGKTGVVVEGPIHPLLADAIEATKRPANAETFILNEDGVPFASPAAFGNRMAEWREQAGLPAELAPCHGLRKALAAHVAENGGTVYEVAATLGHRSTRVADIYTRQAQRKGLAASAAKRAAGLTLG